MEEQEGAILAMREGGCREGCHNTEQKVAEAVRMRDGVFCEVRGSNVISS